jgi:hypothetical protein
MKGPFITLVATLAAALPIACLFVAFAGCRGSPGSSQEALLRVWSNKTSSVEERTAAVNRYFTNGTPVSIVVKVLGTNYTRFRPVLAGAPRAAKTCGLLYEFGDDWVLILTTAPIDTDPLGYLFTGADYTPPSSQ